MSDKIAIENIEAMRLEEGIEDLELRRQIQGLHAGNFVRITFLTAEHIAETLGVRITRIRAGKYWGRIATKPSSRGLANLQVGQELVFSSAHIHSIPTQVE